jgi:hypothetical protein
MRLNNQGLEIVNLKRKIQNLKLENAGLKLALKTCRGQLARAKARGFDPGK